jgi:aspartyl/glutamyl-tRNA(Asn/Gln) amidotransferase C subunit
MKLDPIDVKTIAELAHIQLEPHECAKLEQDLTRVLDWVGQLTQVATTEDGSTFGHSVYGPHRPAVLAPDVVEEGVPLKDLLGNAPGSAPASNPCFFTVPKVLE